MRVLVVDQDSASNLAITRSLRDLYTVDCVTNKGDCLDLLRSNTFEVIVATERLEDGSGLELLGQISKKWPSVLRIFAADRQRLQLLRGRLGPFQLFQTLAYPIDPERLIATLEMAAAAQNGDAGPADIQHIELGGEAPEEAAEPAELAEEPASDFEEPMALEESDEFSAPRFARAAPAEQAQAASGVRRPSGRGGSASPARSAAPVSSARSRDNGAADSRGGGAGGSASSSRGNGAGGSASSSRGGDGAARVGSGSSSDRGAAAGGSRGSSSSRGRSAASAGRDGDLAAKFPGSGTIGPRRDAGSSPGASRGARSRSGASKAPPVRFPPLERTPPLERVPPLESQADSSSRRSGTEFSEAAAMARAARSNYDATSDEFDTKRLGLMVGGGIAAIACVVFLGFKMFGSKSETPKPPGPLAVHAPQYPPEVMDVVAQTEAAFKADDFKTARQDVDKLRQLSPSHPRLDFFEGLLTARADASAKGGGVAAGRSAGSKKSGRGSGSGGGGSQTSPSEVGNGGGASGGMSAAVASTTAGGTGSGGPHGSAAAGLGAVVAGGAGGSGAGGLGTGGSGAAESAMGSLVLPPETPVGFSKAAPPSSEAGRSSAEAAAGPGSAGPATAAAGSAASAAASTTASTASGSATAAPSSATMALAPTSAAISAPTQPAVASARPAAEPVHTPTPAPSARRGSGEPPPVIQEAKLIRRVNPDYPSAAKKDGIAGSVDLEVSVSSQGVVEDVSVVRSTPPDMFEKSAVAAVRKWKYDPRFVDGLPSQAHLKVHLEFGPNK